MRVSTSTLLTYFKEEYEMTYKYVFMSYLRRSNHSYVQLIAFNNVT